MKWACPRDARRGAGPDGWLSVTALFLTCWGLYPTMVKLVERSDRGGWFADGRHPSTLCLPIELRWP